MSKIVAFTKRFIADDEGLETVEYAVMTALIVAALAVAITALAGAITTQTNATAETVGGIDSGG